MEMVFLGRQPIFDRRQKIFGYELLYRASGGNNAYTHQDHDQASKQVIHNSMNVLPLNDVVGARRAFINFTRRLLLDQVYTVLPTESAVVELLETVKVDAEVIEACKVLKEAGYLLALDDFVEGPEYAPLLEHVDILKIDFLVSDSARRKHFVDTYGGKQIMLLAEKVESHEDFQEAMDLGYSYFQGYFFCKPEIMSGREVPVYKQNYLRFVQELNKSPMNFERIEEIVKCEVSLASKLLRYLNSSAVGVRHRITSIKQALAMLGEEPLRKWASLAALSALGDGKPPELLVTCLVRARFCELLGPFVGLPGRALDTFLMGLFSAMDALMDQPLDLVISDIPVAADVSAALLGANTLLGKTYRMVLAFERGNSAMAEFIARDIKVPLPHVSELYQQALHWVDQGMSASLAA
ncbi:MAG: EAL domain-containing protein [Tepidisphaeraceae bacterium]|jgi:EAL and modified HD-GYP domain-containing signal transduction protein